MIGQLLRFGLTFISVQSLLLLLFSDLLCMWKHTQFEKKKKAMLFREPTLYSNTLRDLRVTMDDLSVWMWLKFDLSKAPLTSYQQQNMNIQMPPKWDACFMGL